MGTAQRRPRWLMAFAMMLATLAAVALALAVTPWFLAALPLTLTAASGAWLGLSNEAVLGALDGAGDDAGRGPAGMAP